MKKYISIAFIAIFFSCILGPYKAYADNTVSKCDHVSQSMNANCSFFVSENKKMQSNIKDGDISTVWKAHKGTYISINSQKEIGALYIIWDRQPVSWTLHSFKKQHETPLVNGGENGFLHEYVPLAYPHKSLVLHFNDNEPAIADLYVFEPGNVPDWVQQWKPMLDKADMLVYSTHADDELIWFGGTLPVYAGERHKKVQVAYLIHHGATRNEYCRNHELLDGLWTSGVKSYPIISDFKDYYSKDLNTALKKYDENKVLEYSVMLLRRFKPDVVIGHDPNGEYGHGAHRLCSYALQKAIALSKDSNSYPDCAKMYGTWDVKKCYLHLYKTNPLIMDWDTPLQAFDGKTGMEIAKDSYQCHKSQTKKWFRIKGKGSPYDCRKFGLYYSTVGLDIDKNDFFEHIKQSPTTTTTTSTTISTTTAVTTNKPTTDISESTDIVPVMGNNYTHPSNKAAQMQPKAIVLYSILASIVIVVIGITVLSLIHRKHLLKYTKH